MRITLNTANFLVNLFTEYRNKIYIHMRKNNYSLQNILEFINGYTTVVELCGHYLLNVEMSYGCNPITNTINILFETKDEMICVFEKSIEPIYKEEYSKWEYIGIKYAICLANYYINHILYGNDTEYEDELYMHIPNNDDPDSYDWEARGWKEKYDNIMKEAC